MKTFEQIKEELGFILKKRENDTIPLALAKGQYNLLLQEFAEKLKQEFPDRGLPLEDYIIDSHTSFQEFNLKLENIIKYIEIQFLSEMGLISIR